MAEQSKSRWKTVAFILAWPLGFAIIFFITATASDSPRAGSPPTPTRTMAEGVIELAKIYRTPTGDSLMVNLAWFDIENERWTAKPRDSDWDWLVTLRFTLNGKSQIATWAYRVDSKELTPLDEVARFLLYHP